MKKLRAGFTLVELLVVIAILGILLIGLIATLDPSAQLAKSRDARRVEEIQSIKGALDSYYNDYGCYPTTLNFGFPWQVGSTVYLRTIPQDPTCGNSGGSCYAYQTDGTSCPQWNVVYAKFEGPATNIPRCSLETLSSCLPPNYHNLGYNYCAYSGNVDCSIVDQSGVTESGPGPTIYYVTPGPSPTPLPTLSPTPVPTDTCTPRIYGCISAGNGHTVCNAVGMNSPAGQFCGYPGCQGNACCNYACH